MATHDYVISNQSFPSTRTDINNVLQAIVSNNSNATAPATTFANMIWYDTANNKLYIRNEDNDAWIELFVLDQTGDHLEKIGDTITLDGTGQVGIGITPTAQLHISGDDVSNQVIIENTSADANNAPDLLLRRNSSSPADDDEVGQIVFQGRNDNSQFPTLATMRVIYKDVTDTTEDAALVYELMTGGTKSEVMRIEGGNVGIGTSSPVRKLHVHESGSGANGYIHLTNANTGATTTDGFSILNSGTNGRVTLMQRENEAMIFSTNATERMRIDSSGNLLVAQTSGSSADVGHILAPTGAAFHIRDGGVPLILDRQTSNGDLALLRKDGTEIGTLGIFGGNTLLIDGAASIYAANNVRPNANDTHDLGSASYKWRDIYTVGAVNTSDQNEKQQIAELTTTELAAAKRISALFKTFKWNNAVEEKGDNARTHAGIIAQDVRDALIAEGLDAGNYAFWCSSTWWEHDVEVPAVEAVEAQDAVYEDVVIEAVLDDDGNEIEAERIERRLVSEAVEAIEAQDAYTRTDVYDTADEAPEGATEVTQQSVRYNELMAFVGAATEQRLTSIEARLTALEG